MCNLFRKELTFPNRLGAPRKYEKDNGQREDSLSLFFKETSR